MLAPWTVDEGEARRIALAISRLPELLVQTSED
jgi:hypothetical protein